MGRNGMGRKGYGPKWSWAEMVMGRNDPEPKIQPTGKALLYSGIHIFLYFCFKTDYG